MVNRQIPYGRKSPDKTADRVFAEEDQMQQKDTMPAMPVARLRINMPARNCAREGAGDHYRNKPIATDL
jgi:hypothetical protein